MPKNITKLICANSLRSNIKNTINLSKKSVILYCFILIPIPLKLLVFRKSYNNFMTTVKAERIWLKSFLYNIHIYIYKCIQNVHLKMGKAHLKLFLQQKSISGYLSDEIVVAVLSPRDTNYKFLPRSTIKLPYFQGESSITWIIQSFLS